MAESKKDTKAQPPAPRRLLRSRSERVLWGVAGGLADYLRVDPTWVRLGFVAAVFFGGFGILAYLVMAVVVPEDDGSGRPVSGRRPPTWALILLGIAVIFVLPGPFFWGGGDGGGWWWGFGGLFWLALLAIAGVLAYRALSGRPVNLFGRDDRAEATAKEARASGRKAASEEPTAEAGEPPRVARALALIALVVLAICCACALAGLAVWATATGSGAVIAGVVIALGIALGATAFIADSRRAAPWLLALALVLALPAGATAAADVRFDGGIGEQEYTPTSVAEIPTDGYEHGMGRLVVDLRELPWSDGQVVPLRADLGIGQLVVSVPEDVCVVGDADAKAGHLLIRGESNGGVDPEFQGGDPAGNPRRLDLDGEVQVGELVVTDEDPDEFERRDDRDDAGDDDAQKARQDEACDR